MSGKNRTIRYEDHAWAVSGGVERFPGVFSAGGICNFYTPYFLPEGSVTFTHLIFFQVRSELGFCRERPGTAKCDIVAVRADV